ncbi:hypothetical protein [Streptomyces sp. NBC_01190]|uniref:hypothetical protein n=1 Tax=Streptomyces sp. NBC_01190 TaxID=2903767 RepID=UPI00386544E7|nr:hypothetical protein OG519_06570 [Streptomyces sp. NBC_01190]
MPRRVSLPGADELFRTTGGAALQAPQPRQHSGGEAQSPSAPGDGDARGDGSRQDGGHDGEADPRSGRAAGYDGGRDSRDDRNTRDGRDGRDTPPAPRRQQLTAERAGVQSAAAGVPTVTATVTPQIPSPLPGQSQGPSQAQQPSAQARRKASRQNRRPSGRERHDEKITVYVSAEELMDLEHARLVLRGEHGLAIDRGRIVREAVAVVLADLESRGDASILVRRLRGR